MRSGPNPSPLRTMNAKHDTVDVLLAVALDVAEAVLVLTVALVALVLTVVRPTMARWRPAAAPAPSPVASTDTPDLPALVQAITDAPPAPLLHPLALLAEQLEALPVILLRPLAGVSSKRHRKAELIDMVADMGC